MSDLFMLDTNVVSFILKKNVQVIDHRIELASDASLCISVITKAELLYGLALKPQNASMHGLVRKFFKNTETLAWNDEAAEIYGMLRASLKKRGTILQDMDLLIASHALAAQATLVTNDRSFRHVEGLKTEDWVLPLV
jgi:tRNA(fMet)-specific endonuclease VapC